MSSSSDQIEGKYPGLAVDPDHGNPQLGLLSNKVFKAYSPPDIQPNTRILAICGIADNVTKISLEQAPKATLGERSKIMVLNALAKGRSLFSASKRQSSQMDKEVRTAWTTSHGLASPLAEGWFFADFYLFHHLFKNAGAHQLWLTCEPPETLVAKYTEFLHEVRQDRRVVLDDLLLPEVLKSDNIRLYSRESLLEDFMRILKIEAEIATENKQNVLLLVFGHGDPATYGIQIGGRNEDWDEVPRLTIEMIRRAVLGSDARLTLMICSCYSGGWLYSTDINHSAAAGAGPDDTLLSTSQSFGAHYHRSFWAKAVTRAFIKMEDERMAQDEPGPSAEIDDEVIRSSTFAKLGTVIHDTLLQEVDLAEGRHSIRFAAQDDEWELEWRKRSGTPLQKYEELWKSLRQIPEQDISTVSTPQLGYYHCNQSLNKFQAKQVITELCVTYLHSYPGPSNFGGNTAAHGLSTQLIKGADMSDGQIDYIRKIILFRLNLMQLVTQYRSILGLEYPDCNKFDVEAWEQGKARKQIEAMHFLGSSIVRAGLFPAQPTQHYFIKPAWYLSCLFIDHKKTDAEILDAFALLNAQKSEEIDRMISLIRDNENVQREARIAFRSLGKRRLCSSPASSLTKLGDISHLFGHVSAC